MRWFGPTVRDEGYRKGQATPGRSQPRRLTSRPCATRCQPMAANAVRIGVDQTKPPISMGNVACSGTCARTTRSHKMSWSNVFARSRRTLAGTSRGPGLSLAGAAHFPETVRSPSSLRRDLPRRPRQRPSARSCRTRSRRVRPRPAERRTGRDAGADREGLRLPDRHPCRAARRRDARGGLGSREARRRGPATERPRDDRLRGPGANRGSGAARAAPARCSCWSPSGMGSTSTRVRSRSRAAPPPPSSCTPPSIAWCLRARSRRGSACWARRASRFPEPASWSRFSKAGSRAIPRS